MTTPTVSVVMPNYNHGKSIGRSIEAIVSQSRQPDEILILDDASTDNSMEIIESYARQHPLIRTERNERNGGVVAAVRRLLEMSKGEYICGASSDDYYLPGYIENAMEMAALYPEAGVIFGNYILVDHAGNQTGVAEATFWKEKLFANPRRFLDEYLEKEAPYHSPSPATVYKRGALKEVGSFRQDLGCWADTFAIRAIGLKYGACYLAHSCAAFTMNPNSYSSKAVADPREILSVVAKAATLMRSPEFSPYFPADHVARWEKGYRDAMLDEYVWETQRAHEKAERSLSYGMSLGSKNDRLLGRLFGRFSAWNWEMRRKALRSALAKIRYD